MNDFKKLLQQKKIRQNDLADAIGVSQGLISQWCTGVCQPKLKIIKQMSAYLDVSIEEVLNCFAK